MGAGGGDGGVSTWCWQVSLAYHESIQEHPLTCSINNVQSKTRLSHIVQPRSEAEALPVSALAWAPDGNRLAVAHSYMW
jgi:hypothetical protein